MTTISRMTHKNIVRYYQAWVEGADGGIQDSDDIEELSQLHIDENTAAMDHDGVLENKNDDNDDDDDDDNDNGWWTNSPQQDLLMVLRSNQNKSDDQESDSSSNSSWSDEGDEPQKGNGHYNRKDSGQLGNFRDNLHSESMVNLLEHENDHGLQVSRN